MPILIAVVPLEARPARPAGGRGPLEREYELQHLATSPRRGEILVHVEADSPRGLAAFRRDYPEARTQPTHAPPDEWGDDWQQNSFPSELNRAENANPFDAYRRGIERGRVTQAGRHREGRREGEASTAADAAGRPGQAELDGRVVGTEPSPP